LGAEVLWRRYSRNREYALSQKGRMARENGEERRSGRRGAVECEGSREEGLRIQRQESRDPRPEIRIQQLESRDQRQDKEGRSASAHSDVEIMGCPKGILIGISSSRRTRFATPCVFHAPQLLSSVIRCGTVCSTAMRRAPHSYGAGGYEAVEKREALVQ